MADNRNLIIQQFAKQTRTDLVSEMNSLGVKHRANSESPRPAQRALSTRTRRKSGLIERVGFRMPRHMVFVHKGVGRGTPIAKVGTTNRKAKEWFNPVMEKAVEKLGDDLAAEYADLAIGGILIK